MTSQTAQEDAPRSRTRRSGSERRRLVADAALTVLAEQGARGLTHRAVDEAAGLPQGSTSNVFRSRAALLEGALERHAGLDLATTGGGDAPAPSPPGTREAAIELISGAVQSVIDTRELTVARFELLLESTRRQELREPIEEARRRFTRAAHTGLAATGCQEPERHAKQLLATLDGIVIASLHGDDAALSREEIRELVGRVFATC